MYPRLLDVIGAITLSTLLSITIGAVAASPAEDASTSGVSAELDRLVELNLMSAALIAKAASGSAPAHEFQLEARMYRELLRQTMLSNRSQPIDDQLPQQLLLDMVRMSALLHSAADCKTGFVITCPADLMLQLKTQQSKVVQGQDIIQTTPE